MTVMAGTRLTDLARELKMTHAELLLQLHDLGVQAQGLTAMLDLETANTVRALLGKAVVVKKTVEVSHDPALPELAIALGLSPADAQARFIAMGELVSINQKLTDSTAERLAAECGAAIKFKVPPKSRQMARRHGAGAEAQTRPPVVTVMGHVDHGKTTLLDTIRKANVAGGEFGGITQHIGAYQVEVEHDGEKRKITFIDTPGHKAFTAMRARGASVTDIVVLVVAADDGLMPQTDEAINHAQAAGVPIIVAVNKSDLPDANPDRVKTQLTERNVVVEDYGGTTPAVLVSAKTGAGVPELLEYILLVAEVQELKAEYGGDATGTIIESRVETGRGAVATVLVQGGTLKQSDAVVAGSSWGKVRAMTNERFERLDRATPSTPVEIIGLNAAPQAGDTLEVVKNEREARTTAERRSNQQREERLTPAQHGSLTDLFKRADEAGNSDLNVIVKADVHGSLEAVLAQLNEMEQVEGEEVIRAVVKHSGVGGITEADAILAEATGAIIIGFNSMPDAASRKLAQRNRTEIRTYTLIYELVEDLDRLLKGRLEPITQEFELGKALVRKVFHTPRGVYIAGSYVSEGKIVRGAEARILRAGELVHAGRIDSLRHIKEDVRDIAQGFECGITVVDWNDVQEGDVVECFEVRVVERD